MKRTYNFYLKISFTLDFFSSEDWLNRSKPILRFIFKSFKFTFESNEISSLAQRLVFETAKEPYVEGRSGFQIEITTGDTKSKTNLAFLITPPEKAFINSSEYND